ncbi:2Fe-2S iron-sulfur cluster-binding protein [Kordiimonas pumila]|uniref:2Fe-2S iron-sulfur cluster-binding protein n=1 Tax=Kordiimonas pumila TaxID=2161677 RepID=A0ABV7D8A6_9PROT|nr:2Fe-2S iron-sulfur cluster-binding protein [Kordiimonas pumila]
MISNITNAISLNIVESDIEKTVLGEKDESLLEALQRANVPVAAICGGQMSCGTCHVLLQPYNTKEEFKSPDAEEEMLLEDSCYYMQGQSRLACQIKVDKQLSKYKIVIVQE